MGETNSSNLNGHPGGWVLSFPNWAWPMVSRPSKIGLIPPYQKKCQVKWSASTVATKNLWVVKNTCIIFDLCDDVLFNTNECIMIPTTAFYRFPLSSLFISMKVVPWWLTLVDSAFRILRLPNAVESHWASQSRTSKSHLGWWSREDHDHVVTASQNVTIKHILLGHVSKVIAEFLEQVEDSVQVPCMTNMNQSSISTRSPSLPCQAMHGCGRAAEKVFIQVVVVKRLEHWVLLGIKVEFWGTFKLKQCIGL